MKCRCVDFSDSEKFELSEFDGVSSVFVIRFAVFLLCARCDVVLFESTNH